MTPITMWAVADPNGAPLTHTLDTNKAQAVENFRDAAFPRSPLTYWWRKGYKPVEVVLYLKADADELAAKLDTANKLREAASVSGHEVAKDALQHYAMQKRNADHWRAEWKEARAVSNFYKDELAKAQAGADEMAALAWKWKYKADCLRETIRCLVVAFRIVWYCVVNEYPRALPTIKRLMDERRQAKQAGEA